MASKSNEFFYIDENGRKTDRALHEEILGETWLDYDRNDPSVKITIGPNAGLVPDGKRMKRWKLAISLAVVAAIAVPLLAGTWRLAEGKWEGGAGAEAEYDCFLRWKKLGEDCSIELGVWHPPEVTWSYLATNLLVSAGAFALTFALVMIVPPIGHRYWLWLRR
jgi:hypothetical protein